MNTAQVKAAIRNYYPTNEYALMWEVGNTTGASARRFADAVVVSLWPSRGLTITGIEIKVSRSDWRREIENPAKAEAIAKFCDFWTIVTPEGIVQEHELPFNWGHMVVNEKGAIRVVKKPLTLEPEPLSRGFVAAMLRRASEADASVIKAMVDREVAREREGLEREIQRRVDRATRQFSSIQTKVEELKKLGLDLASWEDAGYVAESYEIGTKFKQAMNGLRHNGVVSHLEKLLDLFGKVRDDLDPIHPSRKD